MELYYELIFIAVLGVNETRLDYISPGDFFLLWRLVLCLNFSWNLRGREVFCYDLETVPTAPVGSLDEFSKVGSKTRDL